MAFREEQYLADYAEYYNFMAEKYGKLGYDNYAQVFRDILALLEDSADFAEFQRRFQEEDFTLKMGRSRVQDEALIRQRAYMDTLIHVKRHYWSQDDAQVHYEGDEPLADEPRAQWAEAMAEAAGEASNLVDLTTKVNQANQEQGTAMGAEEIYQAFDVDIILIEYIRSLQEAEVPHSGYPGVSMPEKDLAQDLGLKEPKSYPESMELDIADALRDYRETRSSIEESQKRLSGGYDYSLLWEKRHRRAYSVTDEVLQSYINKSQELGGE
jgi:hypothetical protein